MFVAFEFDVENEFVLVGEAAQEAHVVVVVGHFYFAHYVGGQAVQREFFAPPEEVLVLDGDAVHGFAVHGHLVVAVHLDSG